MSFRFAFHESGSLELTSPHPSHIRLELLKAGADRERANEAELEVVEAKGPDVGPIDAGNGVTITRRLERRRRVYTIAWSRTVERSGP